ncbi:hypothetical protein FACS189447_02860 [Spirochaetia bacterium]|nr:hypothetical protein FACS189447_02860 [Spirochaetia bacterium]
MTTTYEKGIDFEQFWATFQANKEQHEKEMKEIRESQKETARQMQETDRQMQETDRLIQELRESQKETACQMQETDRQIKATDKQLGKLGNRFGEMVEYLIVPNLVEKFRELNFTFTKAYQDTVITDREHGISTEIDAFLENGDKVMIVEIKNKPTTEHVNEHVRRMEKLRAYANLHNDQRNYLGAIAGVVMTENVKEYAFKNGFYVLEPSGDTFNIFEPKGDYKPKAW